MVSIALGWFEVGTNRLGIGINPSIRGSCRTRGVGNWLKCGSIKESEYMEVSTRIWNPDGASMIIFLGGGIGKPIYSTKLV